MGSSSLANKVVLVTVLHVSSALQGFAVVVVVVVTVVVVVGMVVGMVVEMVVVVVSTHPSGRVEVHPFKLVL